VTNSGTLVTSSGSLSIGGTISNSKTIEALGTGATVTITGTISNTASGVVLASGTGAGVALDGGSISGGTAAAISGGTLTLSGGTIGSATIVETLSGGTALVSGTVSNSGTLLASASHSLVEITSGAVVNGGTVEVGNGIVDIQSGGSANVTFLSTGDGGLEIADTKGDPTAFTGVMSGFGGTSHANHTQFIDLVSVTSAASQIAVSYTSVSNSSGTLTVTSGGSTVAEITLSGNYVTSDFHVSAGTGGTVEITDPTVVGGGVQSANIALFGN
jgi:hypothetical protein